MSRNGVILMRERVTAAALLLALAVPMLCAGRVQAQTTPDKPVGANASRPAKAPESQTSLPSNAPPATTTEKTGSTNQPPTVKAMNKDASAKTNQEGK